MFPRLLAFLALAWCGALATVATTGAQTMDTLTFGDTASEGAHSLAAPLSETFTGGMGQVARRLLPKEDLDVYGGELVFTMAVDPVKQNYLTLKMWGSDTGGSWLILNCNGREVGGRHGAGFGEDPLYFSGNGWYPNRFFYRTSLLPIGMTRGQTSVTLRIRSCGTIYFYAPIRTYVPQYQHYMTAPTPGIYKAYTHAGSLVDVTGEAQGTAPSAPTPRTLENETTVVANTKTNVNNSLASKLNAAGSALSQTDASFLAQCYDAKTNAGATWITYPTGKSAADVGNQIVAALDALVTSYALDAGVASNGWGGGLPDMGDAVRLAWPLLSGAMSAPVAYGGTLGTVTRRAGWSAALRASVDSGRYNRRTIANQEIACGWAIYRANRGLLLVDPANALNESEAIRYFKEACGILPFLGNDQTGGGPIPVRGTAPYGPDWFMCTSKGTTKDGDGFVGSDYGELGSWIYKMGLLSGDSQIVDRGLLMTRARCQFRYPSVDDKGYFIMQGTDPIGVRNNDLPSHYVYLGRGYGDDLLMASQGAAAIGNDLLGYYQQAMNDGQLVRSTFATDPYLPGRWATFRALPPTNVKLPTTPGQPDYAWVDEENMAVTAKHGEERFYANLYWRQPGFINGFAKVFHLTPTTAHLADVVIDDLRFRSSGRSIIGGPSVDGFVTPVDNPTEAFAGWPALVALRSDLADASVLNGKTNRDAGRGTGYSFRYGNWLVGINAHYTDTYAMQLPSDFPASARDLVSGAMKSGPVVLAPKTSAVFYLGSVPPPGVPPSRTLYTAAAGGNRSVSLTWNHAGGAASYNVLRSTVSGSGYATLATGVTANGYTDNSASNGTTYYYVVQSVSAAGTSGHSPEASATPAAPGTAALAPPWGDLDLGASTGGTATNAGGTFTVKSGPGDLWGNADGCHFVYQPLLGDGTVIARVQSQSSTNNYAKSGLAIRSSLAANATRVSVAMEPSGRAEMDYRGADGGSTSNAVTGGGLALPYWVRLTRTGATVTGYVSPDGITWTAVNSYNATNLPYAAYVGLVTAPASGGAGQTNTAVFTNVNFPLGATAAPATPTGLSALGGKTSVALAWTGVPGAASYRVKRGSTGAGPFTTVANVVTGTAFTDFGRPVGSTVFYVVSAVNDAGESLNSAAVSTTPSPPPPAVGGLAAIPADSQVTLTWDAVPGATGYTVRRGTQYAFITNLLASGLTATTFADATAVNGTTYLYSVTASTNGSEGVESVVDATPPGLPAPWLTRDIGAVDLPGAGTSTDGAAFTLSASGHDIWSTADEFRYVYRMVTGDCDLITRVADNTATAAWAKAGVMIRNSLAPGAAYAMMMVTPGNGVSFQKRASDGASASAVSTSSGGGTITAPYWVRLKRVGNAFTAYASPDPATAPWTQIGATQTIAMNATCCLGLALTSLVDNTLATAHFDGVALAGGGPPAAPAALSASAGDTAVALSWNAPSAGFAGSYHVKRAATAAGPYATVATATTAAYQDTGLTNGTACFYVVSALDGGGESPDSTPPASATPHASYRSWQARYFTSAQLGNPTLSSPGGDANGDGTPNVVAYAFNVSPWGNVAGALPTTRIVGGYLTITFTRRKAPADVTYTVAVSGDLATWNTGAAFTTETGVTPLDADTEQVTVRDNTPISTPPRFLRLEIGY